MRYPRPNLLVACSLLRSRRFWVSSAEDPSNVKEVVGGFLVSVFLGEAASC